MGKAATMGALITTVLAAASPAPAAVVTNLGAVAGGTAFTHCCDLLNLDEPLVPATVGLVSRSGSALRRPGSRAATRAAVVFPAPSTANVAQSPACCASNWRFFRDRAIDRSSLTGLPDEACWSTLDREPGLALDGWRALTATIDQSADATTGAGFDRMRPDDDPLGLDAYETEAAYDAWQAGHLAGTAEVISLNPSSRGAAERFKCSAAAGPLASHGRVGAGVPGDACLAARFAARPEPATIALAGLGGIALRRWRRT